MADKSQIRMNAEADPTYRPYCMRCTELRRMEISERFLWVCGKCLAVHDERTDKERIARQIDDMLAMDVFLTGGVGLTNGGRGWP